MKKIRLFASVIPCVLMVLGLAACGSKASDEGTENSESRISDVAEPDKAEADTSEADTNISDTGETADRDQTGSKKDTLVVVFSATGTTKGVAEKIASITDADLYEIIPAEPYSDADLDWHDKNSRTTIEQDDPSVRPAIGSGIISLDGYRTIYIGYPIWWGEEPRIMDTFVESYSFDGITMIPFCTSGGSGIGRSGKNLEENAGSGSWLDGDRLQGGISDADLQDWIDGFK